MNAETIDLMRRYLMENGVRYNDSISTMVVRRNRGGSIFFYGASFCFDLCVAYKSNEMLMYGKVSQENYVELTAASAIPNKEIKSPQILRY